MATLHNACPPYNTTLGDHRPLPQTHTMALLLAHATYVQAYEYPFRWCRAYDRFA